MNEREEHRVLETLAAPIEHDLQLADPEARIEWVAEGGEWWYRAFGSMATFESVGFVQEPSNEADREIAIVSIAWNIAYNLWPDEWTDPWPLCPAHGDVGVPRRGVGRPGRREGLGGVRVVRR